MLKIVKKPILIIIASIILLLAGAGFLYLQNQKSSSSSFPSKTVLALTKEPQDAEFYIRTGWVGGGGSAPILDPSGNRPLRFNDKPIFFDESKLDKVRELGKVSACTSEGSAILVKANVTLTSRVGVSSSIPPDTAGHRPAVSYYEAVVNKLYNVVEPCSTDHKPNDTVLDDPNLLYAARTTIGLCNTKQGKSGSCYSNTYLYISGKLVTESHDVVMEPDGEKKVDYPVTEKTLDKNTMDQIIKQIRDSGILTKPCEIEPIMDLYVDYFINLDGVKKEIKFPGCSLELNEINKLIGAVE